MIDPNQEIQLRVEAAVSELQSHIQQLATRAANLAGDLAVCQQQKALVEGELRSAKLELEEKKGGK